MTSQFGSWLYFEGPRESRIALQGLHQLEIGLFLTLLFLFIFNFLFIMEKEKTYLLCAPIYSPHAQIILKQIPNISFHP